MVIEETLLRAVRRTRVQLMLVAIKCLRVQRSEQSIDAENAAKTVRADALLEFRMNYTNLVTRSFAISHQAQDSPLDFDHIRRMCTRLKSYMINPETGRQGNVAVHADPAYWQPGESPANVARFMSSLVTSGVPMLSTDLRTLEGNTGASSRPGWPSSKNTRTCCSSARSRS